MQRKPNTTNDYKSLYDPYLLFITPGRFSPATLMMLNSNSILLFKEQISNLTVNSNLTRILAREQKLLRDRKTKLIENFAVILHMIM